MESPSHSASAAPPPLHPGGRCRACDHELFGARGPGCPECGEPFRPATMPGGHDAAPELAVSHGRRVRGPVVVTALLGLLVLPIPLFMLVAGIINVVRSLL